LSGYVTFPIPECACRISDLRKRFRPTPREAAQPGDSDSGDPDHRHRRLLRTHGKPPRRRAAEQRDEIASMCDWRDVAHEVETQIRV
jgi:hypothetical protein